jgi:hypothetical protein
MSMTIETVGLRVKGAGEAPVSNQMDRNQDQTIWDSWIQLRFIS